MISSLLANGLRMTFKFSLSYSALQKKSHILSYDILWSCTAQQARSHGFSVTPPPVFLCVCEWKGVVSMCVSHYHTLAWITLRKQQIVLQAHLTWWGQKRDDGSDSTAHLWYTASHTCSYSFHIHKPRRRLYEKHTLSCCQLKTDLNNNKIGTISNVCHFSGLLVQPVKQHPSANTWTGLSLVSVLYSWN